MASIMTDRDTTTLSNHRKCDGAVSGINPRPCETLLRRCARIRWDTTDRPIAAGTEPEFGLFGALTRPLDGARVAGQDAVELAA